MIEENRRNRPLHPTAEERQWMSASPIAAVLRLAVFLVVSVAVGTSTSLWIERTSAVPQVAKAGK